MIISTLILFFATGILSQGQYSPIEKNDIFDISDAPWQVSIQVNGEHHCGGALVSRFIVLTAPLCFYTTIQPVRALHRHEILIIAGSELKRSRENLAEIYALYSTKFIEHDSEGIGIIILQTPLQHSIYISWIPWLNFAPAIGQIVLASGWGYINENLYGFSTYTEACTFATIKHICIRSLIAPRKPLECIEDLGGPLAYYYNNRYHLVGVITTRNQCNGPAVYSNVAYYNNMIHQFLTGSGLWNLTLKRGGQ